MPFSLLYAQFLIVGSRRTTRTFGQLDWPCEKCHRTTRQGVQAITSKGTVFFVPLIPFGTSYRFACGGCGHTMTVPQHVKPQVEAWAQTGQRPPAAVLAIPTGQVVAALPLAVAAGTQLRKSPVVAVLLSFLFSGLGHIYLGSTRKGVLLIAAQIANLFLALVVIGLFTGFAVWVYGMVDAYKLAARTTTRGSPDPITEPTSARPVPSVVATPRSPEHLEESGMFTNEFRTAEQTIIDWLGQLKGKPIHDIEALFGPPAKRDTWEFEGMIAPKLHFDTPGQGQLQLFFFANKVITVMYMHTPK